MQLHLHLHGSGEIHIHMHNNGDEQVLEVLNLLNTKIDFMAKTQAELAAEMVEVTKQLEKVGNESAKSVAKIAELEEVIKNLPNVEPALQDAFDAVKAQVKLVDDMVPDATEPPPVV